MPATSLRIAEGFRGQRLTVLPPSAVDRARRLPVCRDLGVTHCGRFDRVLGHYVDRPRGRPEYVLIVCLSGSGRVELKGRAWPLAAGHGIVLPPRQAHRYAADMDNPWTIFWFHFSGRRARDYVAALDVTADKPRFWVQNIDTLAQEFEDTYRYVLGGYTDQELIGLTTSFVRLLGVCRNLQRSPVRRHQRTEDRVLKALRFMRQNLHRALSLAEMARQAGLSSTHFGAVFRAQLNCSPLEFHIRLKMQRACELLESTLCTVAEIGGAVGYEDPLYFSRMFRLKVGRSPRAYRVANHSAHGSRLTPARPLR